MYNGCISPGVGFRVSGSVPIRFSESCCCVDGGFQLQRCRLWSTCGVSCLSSCYCCCSKLCVHRVDLSSSLVYGSRQSSLLQCSVGRRLKFGSGVYTMVRGIDRVDYGLECCDGDWRRVSGFEAVEYGGGRERWAGRGKGRIRGLEFVERREWRRYAGGLSEAEDIIDLLADNVVESSVVSFESKVVRPRRKSEGKKENVCDECSRRKMKIVDSGSSRGKSRHDVLKETGKTSTRHGHQIKEDCRYEKKNNARSGGSESLQRQSRHEELTRTHRRRRSEGVNILAEKTERLRKEGSGCASYYSISEDIESDEDIASVEELDNSTCIEGQLSKFNKEFRNRNDEESHDFFEETERRRNKQQGIQLKETVATGSREGNVVVWDRKKSEKQLVETAVDQSQSAAATAEKRYTASETYNSSYNKSDISHKQFQSSHDNSSLISNGRERRIHSDTTDYNDISISGKRYNKESEFEEVRESDDITNSNQLVQSSVRKDNVSKSTKLTYARNERIEQELGRSSSQQHTGTIRIQEIDDTEDVSNLHRDEQSASAQEHREQELVRRSSQQNTGTVQIQGIDNTSEVSKLRQDKQSISVQELKEDHRLRISTITESELRRHSQQITNISEINRSEIQETNSGSGSSSATGQSQVESTEIRSRKGSRASLGSLVESSALTTTIDSQETSHQRVRTSEARVAEEKMDRISQFEESYKHNEARRERQRVSQESSLRQEVLEEAFKLSFETRAEKILTKADDKRTTHAAEMVAMHQLQSGSSSSEVPTTPYIHEMASQDGIEDRYHSQLHQQGQHHSSEIESYGVAIRDDTTYVEPHISSEDALGSAERMENSSNVLIEEFIEQAKLNLRASEVHEGKLRKTESENEGSNKQALVKYVSAEMELPSPEGSEPKGPSDDKWDVTQSSVEPPAKVQTPEVSPKARNTTGKRTGRSLWNVIVNVVRARWIFHGEDQSSPSKSQKQGSSNKSSSDSWFSGHEQDELLIKEAERRSPFAQSTSSSTKVKPETEHSKSPRAGSNAKLVIHKNNVSSSSLTFGFLGISSSAHGVSPNSVEAKPSPSGPEMSTQATLTSPGLLGTSPSLPSLPSRRLNRSPVIGSTSLRARDDQTTSSSAELIDQQPSPLRLSEASTFSSSVPEMSFLATYKSPGLLQNSPSLPSRRLGRSPAIGSTSLRALDDRTASSSAELSDQQPSHLRLTEGSEPEEKEREQARRKLQRTMQVPRDKFEEWEEALMLETEQHKIDDIFMREALLEAQKAADNWEVPVGAVLVKDGKIIARGCNLVEELRDSTAHAEMICIRDASNALRTWRLSESTLYVTLEPCAMCAGAILQARVTTLVWGAPNKLLGADGSWIRLFPEDGERDNITELADKPPAPVHPFHPKMNIRRGVLAAECAQVMQQFFHLRRQKKNKSDTSSPPPPSRLPAKLITKVHGLFGASLCL